MKNKKILLLIVTIIVIIGVIFAVANSSNVKNPNDLESGISGNSLSTDELVQNANYTYDVSGSYIINEEEFSLYNIVLPCFMFNTNDANKANEEMEELYKKLATEFEAELNGNKTNIVQSWYDVMHVKGMLSTFVTVQRVSAEEERFEYYSYVFDLDNLNLTNISEQMKEIGVSESELKSKVEEEIRKLEDFENLSEEDCPAGRTPEDYINETLNAYEEALKNNTLVSYIDVMRRLNLIVSIKLPNETGDMQRIITIK